MARVAENVQGIDMYHLTEQHRLNLISLVDSRINRIGNQIERERDTMGDATLCVLTTEQEGLYKHLDALYALTKTSGCTQTYHQRLTVIEKKLGFK